MKKRVLLLSLASVAPAAFAQVQIFGTIDLTTRRIDDGGTKTLLLQREGASSSKLVITGKDDIGGGLAGSFYLDMPVKADTGGSASTPLFDRRSTVSLHTPYGELRFGRDAALQNSIPGDFDALNGKGVGNVMNLATPFNFSATNTFVRVSNAISYLTPPTLGGFYGQVQVAPSEKGVGNKEYAFGVGYSKGPLEVRFTQGHNSTNQVADVNPTTGASAKALSADKFDSTAATASGYWTYTSFGSSYDFGPIKVLGSVTQWVSAKQLGTGLQRKELMLNLGGMVPVGASGSVNFAYTRADRSGLGSDAQDASQLGLQYMYNLSKRTSLYASVAHLRQDALAAVANSRYNMDGTDVTTRSATGVDFGIRVRF